MNGMPKSNNSTRKICILATDLFKSQNVAQLSLYLESQDDVSVLEQTGQTQQTHWLNQR